MKYNISRLRELCVLLIEDDSIVSNEYSRTLNLMFEKVHCADNGIRGFELYEDLRPDIVLLDIGLPDMDGFNIISKIRDKDMKTPIVVLSGNSDVQTLLRAANSNIDGYLVKPIVLEELMVKLLFALKRNDHKVSIIKFKNGMEFNTGLKEIIYKDKHFVLHQKEQQLLELFIENNNRVLSKEEIMDAIWPVEIVTDSALKNLLSRFRNKIGEDILISYKNIGWKLNCELIDEQKRFF